MSTFSPSLPAITGRRAKMQWGPGGTPVDVEEVESGRETTQVRFADGRVVPVPTWILRFANPDDEPVTIRPAGPTRPGEPIPRPPR